MKERRGTDTLMDERDADRRAEMPEDSRKGTGGTGLGTGRERQAFTAAEETSQPEVMMFSGEVLHRERPTGTREPSYENIRVLLVLHEPPYAERHVRWCERLGS